MTVSERQKQKRKEAFVAPEEPVAKKPKQGGCGITKHSTNRFAYYKDELDISKLKLKVKQGLKKTKAPISWLLTTIYLLGFHHLSCDILVDVT